MTADADTQSPVLLHSNIAHSVESRIRLDKQLCRKRRSHTVTPLAISHPEALGGNHTGANR